MKRENLLFWVVCSVSFLAFLVSGLVGIDPDFGWYMSIAKVILKSGIPTHDPFSYTMPSFPYINHEWLSNVLIYFMYSLNPIFANIIYALIPAVALIFCLPVKKTLINLSLLIQSVCVLLSFSGVRAQAISWLLFAILIKVFFDESLWKRFKFFVPILFIFWVNLHGGFAIGLSVFAIFLLSKFWQRSLLICDIFIFVLSITATLINPYGGRVYLEIASSLTDTGLRLKIAEWLPSIFFLNFSWLILIAISAPLIVKFRKKIQATNLTIYLAVFLFSATSIRNIPFFVIANLVLVIPLLDQMIKSFNKDARQRFDKVATWFFVFSLAVLTASVGLNIVSEGFAFPNKYPSEKIIACLEKVSDGQIFSVYNVGGYLDWKLPQKKVFIDGRMPSWRQRESLKESASAFDEYENIIYAKKDYKKSFKKYNIKYVLLPAEVKRVGIMGKIYNVMWGVGSYKKFEQRLKKDKWKVKFGDEGFQILAANNAINTNCLGK